MASGTWLVARREFVERGRSRVFLGVLVGSMLLILGGLFAASLTGRDAGAPPPATVALAGTYPASLPGQVQSAAAAVGLVVRLGQSPSVTAARDEVLSGQADAALVDGAQILSVGPPEPTLHAVLVQAATASARAQAGAELGLTTDEVQRIVRPVSVTVSDLSAEGEQGGSTGLDATQLARGTAAFFSVVVLFILVMAFGQFVGMAVVEEKQSRVAELVLAKVSTSAMLLGKVLGIGGLGLAQLVVLGLTYLAGVEAFGQGSRTIEIIRLGTGTLAWMGLWFALGYLMYSTLFATMGATVSRPEDLQSLTYLPSTLLLPAYVVAGLSLTGTPSALLAPMSLVPWWAPLLMSFRMAIGDAEPWEVLVGLGGSVVFVAALVWFGSRVYRGAALRTGARVSFREAFRAG